jgi:hypothetical protein
MVARRRSNRWLVEPDEVPSNDCKREPWSAAVNVKSKTFSDKGGRGKVLFHPCAVVSPDILEKPLTAADLVIDG